MMLTGLEGEGRIKLSALAAMTGRSRSALLRDVTRGHLQAFQYLKRRGSPWYVERAEARRWWSWCSTANTSHSCST
jgi:hypothetical protein